MLQFGIFDHVDRNPRLSLREYYEARLRLIEAYDRNGFYAYHLAEHHGTPLGLVPSPSVFLSAIAQRTKRLRFGPFVYPMSFYHPLRLAEEIAMVDQLSGGRLELGFGRGSVPAEIAFFGIDPDEAAERYTEGLELVIRALTDEVINHQGRFWQVRDVPRVLAPLQLPHPPIWYGAHSPDSAERAARRGLNVVNNDSPDIARPTIRRYHDTWRALHGDAALPLTGLVRFIVVAETDVAAEAIAARAYPVWLDNFLKIWRDCGEMPGERAGDFATLQNHEAKGIAGSPETVTKFLAAHLEESGANYLVGQFCFGDLGLDEATRSVELFAAHVMPALRAVVKIPA